MSFYFWLIYLCYRWCDALNFGHRHTIKELWVRSALLQAWLTALAFALPVQRFFLLLASSPLTYSAAMWMMVGIGAGIGLTLSWLNLTLVDTHAWRTFFRKRRQSIS